MAENSIQFIQTQNIAPVQSAGNVLRGGASVFVRVLADNGGGQYLVSAGGSRISVASRLPLEPGSTFRASVSVRDGRVLLVPETSAAAVQQESPELAGAGSSPDAMLAALLAAEGLAPDAVSVKLLQFLQQGGFRVDRALMDRARRMALRFPGREREAAEAAALLLEKGIAPTESAVQELLALAGGGASAGEQPQDSAPEPDGGGEGEALLPLFAGSGAFGHEAGLLTLVNHLSLDAEHHWIILPYEWNSGGKVALNGVLRLLLNLRTKNVEKILIKCKTNSTNYFFVLYFNKESKVKEVRFCTLPPLLTSAIHLEEGRLGDLLASGMNAGKSVPVTYSTSALQDGLCCDSELPFLYDRKV